MPNTVLPKAGLNGFDWTFVQGSTFVLRLNFCAKIPRLRQYPNRCFKTKNAFLRKWSVETTKKRKPHRLPLFFQKRGRIRPYNKPLLFLCEFNVSYSTLFYLCRFFPKKSVSFSAICFTYSGFQ